MTELLPKILNKHGGVDLWGSINSISFRLSFGGLAFSSRFQFTGSKEFDADIYVQEPKVIFNNYMNNDAIGIFTKDKVWIEDKNGNKINGRKNPRERMFDFKKQFVWDSLDLLYFAGYALWNYSTFPFLLINNKIITNEISDYKEEGKNFKRLSVKYPDDFPTHSEEQIFYFNNNYELARLDYDPVCFAKWAKAAQYCSDYRSIGGINLPFERIVYPRDKKGKSIKFLKLVWVKIIDAELNR